MADKMTTMTQLNRWLRSQYGHTTIALATATTAKQPNDVLRLEAVRTHINELRKALGELPFQMQVGNDNELLERTDWQPVELD